jgi:hypothetical protein
MQLFGHRATDILHWYKNWRFWGGIMLPIVVLLWYMQTEVDGGAETLERLRSLAWGIVILPVVYLSRRVLANGSRLSAAYRRALDEPVGAGLVFLGLCILMVGLIMLFSARSHAADLPVGAKLYLPSLVKEVEKFWPDHPRREILAALVEQESCISLTHPKCWSPKVELKTPREYGFGLGQKTVAYRADGSERFNAWADSRRAFRAELAGWTWENRYDARMQLRAVVLDNRACYLRMAKTIGIGPNALAMCDAAYNGGFDGVQTDRRMCAASAGCNPSIWFGNVERFSMKSKEKWRGYGASAFDINRGHVRAVTITRPAKYVGLLM